MSDSTIFWSRMFGHVTKSEWFECSQRVMQANGWSMELHNHLLADWDLMTGALDPTAIASVSLVQTADTFAEPGPFAELLDDMEAKSPCEQSAPWFTVSAPAPSGPSQLLCVAPLPSAFGCVR